MAKTSNPPSILLLSGLDPTGGAGISADIRSASRWDVYPLPVITALTAQNHKGVHRIDVPDPDLIDLQLNDIVKAITPNAVKIGMIPDERMIDIIARVIKKCEIKNIVLDPVLSASAGGKLVDNDKTILALVEKLFPLATLVTPNRQEFQKINKVLAKHNRPDIFSYSNATLITGGDSEDSHCIDYLYEDNKLIATFKGVKINSNNLHGTGCIFSTSIASQLAYGCSLTEAISKAKEFLSDSIEASAHLSLIPEYGPSLV